MMQVIRIRGSTAVFTTVKTIYFAGSTRGVVGRTNSCFVVEHDFDGAHGA